MPFVHRNRPQYALHEYDRKTRQSESHKYRDGLLSEVRIFRAARCTIKKRQSRRFFFLFN